MSHQTSSHNIFVYGLLQHPDVLRPLIGFVPEMSEARLDNYIRRVLVHEDFEPCAVAVAEPGKAIEGMVLHDLPPKSVAHLDVFEAVDLGIYRRSSVSSILSCGTGVDCDAYLNGPALEAGNIGDYWNQEAFNSNHMEYVLKELVPRYANY